jgi:hypothetical protein
VQSDTNGQTSLIGHLILQNSPWKGQWKNKRQDGHTVLPLPARKLPYSSERQRRGPTRRPVVKREEENKELMLKRHRDKERRQSENAHFCLSTDIQLPFTVLGLLAMARDYTLQKDRAPRTWRTRSSEEAEGAKNSNGYKPSPGTALQSECRLQDWLHFRIYISIYLLSISCKSTLLDSKPQDLQTWCPPAEKRFTIW